MSNSMSNSQAAYFNEIAAATGLFMSQDGNSLIGVVNGYHVAIETNGLNYQIKFSVRKDSMLPDVVFINDVTATYKKQITNGKLDGNKLVFTVKGALKKKNLENMVTALNGIAAMLGENNYNDVCEFCGLPKSDINPYTIGSMSYQLCGECSQDSNKVQFVFQNQPQQKEENLLQGCVGALLGSLIGVLAIVLIGQLGYVAVIGGNVMAVCTIKGYEMFSKGIGKKGIIACIIIMLLMVYFAERMEWAIEIYKVYKEDGASFFDCYQYAIEVIKESDLMGSFYGDLALTYLFTVIGAASIVRKVLRQL